MLNFVVVTSHVTLLAYVIHITIKTFVTLLVCESLRLLLLNLQKLDHPLKAMLHEAIFLATRIATNVALQVERKNSRVTPHFATAIVALRVARKVERPSTFRNVYFIFFIY